FCADFDEGDVSHAYENGMPIILAAPQVDSNGHLTLDPGGVSGTAGCSAATDAVAAGASTAHARYLNPLSLASAAHVRFRFDFRIDACQSGSNADAAVLTFADKGAGGATVRLYLVLDGDRALTLHVDGTGSNRSASAPLPALGSWSSIAL